VQHPSGGQAATPFTEVNRAGPWLCVSAFRPVCPFEDVRLQAKNELLPAQPEKQRNASMNPVSGKMPTGKQLDE